MGAQAGDAVVGDKGCVLVARTIEGLLDKIYFTSGSEAEKGSRFEKLIVAYLQTAGQYADRFSDVPPVAGLGGPPRQGGYRYRHRGHRQAHR